VTGSPPGRILLTGATGYVGGRLLPLLERTGAPLRCMTRRPEYLAGRVAPATEVVAGDLRSAQDAERALAGVEIAYYLAHAMGDPGSFAEQERAAARTFAVAARAAGVRRIIYLGGLGRGELSPHLASRQEVGQILRESGVPTVELRSSIIIGAGSTSYDMIRSLVTRLPVMVTPRWVRTLTQPIAIDDVLDYLLAARDLPEARTGSRTVG
jgi:uncharacterized protein YbjT (DUF2867 family)